MLSLLKHYFRRPHGTFVLDEIQRPFDDLLYAEYFTLFHLEKFNAMHDHLTTHFVKEGFPSSTHVILHNSANLHLSHIQTVRPSQGKLFYLQTILKHKAVRSYAQAHTVNGTEFDSFQLAASKLGLFADENKAIYALHEAIDTLHTPFQLRMLFVHLLINDCIISPIEVWEKFHEQFSRNFSLQLNNNIDLAKSHCLQQISTNLDECQGRGTLHLHLLIYLVNAPSADETHQLLMSPEFRTRVVAYIRANLRAYLPGLELIDSVQDIPLN